MPQPLRETIQQLAADFAANLLVAIRSVSLEEVLSETVTSRRGRAASAGATFAEGLGRPSARLGRRTSGDIERIVDEIVALLEKHPEGLRSEQIRIALNLGANEMPRPLNDALAARRVTKSGQKRATTYFARGAGGAKGGRGAKKSSVADKKRVGAKSRRRAGAADAGDGGHSEG